MRPDKRRRLPFGIVSSLTSAASCCSLLNYQHREIRDPGTSVPPDVQRRTGKCLDTPQYVNPGWTRVSQKSGYSGPAHPGLSISRQAHPCQTVKSCSGRLTRNQGRPRLAEPADLVEPCTQGLTRRAASNTNSDDVRGATKNVRPVFPVVLRETSTADNVQVIKEKWNVKTSILLIFIACRCSQPSRCPDTYFPLIITNIVALLILQKTMSHTTRSANVFDKNKLIRALLR